jgi:hypothetical protein
MKNKLSEILIVFTTLFLAFALAGCPQAHDNLITYEEFVKLHGVPWTIHYFRADGNYDGWDMFIWPKEPSGDGKGYPFGEPGADGFVTATMLLPGDVSEIGLIVRKGGGSWAGKDTDGDRFTKAREIWLLSGDSKIYEKKP